MGTRRLLIALAQWWYLCEAHADHVCKRNWGVRAEVLNFDILTAPWPLGISKTRTTRAFRSFSSESAYYPPDTSKKSDVNFNVQKAPCLRDRVDRGLHGAGHGQTRRRDRHRDERRHYDSVPRHPVRPASVRAPSYYALNPR